MSIQQTYTYRKKRRCLHCGTPIADQMHASMKFCARQKFPEGYIRCCKDDYHTLRKNVLNAPFKKLVSFHKQTYLTLDHLFKHVGGTITLDHINYWKILLSRPMEFSVNDGMVTYFFHIYAVKQISKSEFKLFKHGKEWWKVECVNFYRIPFSSILLYLIY